MNVHDSSLPALAERVNEGDPSALPAFEQELEHHLTRIVRRALRADASGSALTRRIQAEARLWQRKGDPDSGELADRVAGSLQAAVVGRLRAGCPSFQEVGDTIRG